MDGTAVFTFIQSYGVAAVFVLIMLEYACFPVPSEIVLPLAGAYAAVYGVPFFEILLISVTSGICGCLICYLIGYYGGGALLDRITLRFSGASAGIEASRQWFDRYGSLSVVIGRVLPLCRTYISFIAGLSGQRALKFTALSAIGITVWNLVLVGLGYKLAAHWDIIARYARQYTYILLPFVLLLIALIIVKIKKSVRNIKKHI